MNATSVNMDAGMHYELKKICNEYGISMKQLITLILKYIRKNLNKFSHAYNLTRYQKRIKGRKWKCVRINFSENECKNNFFSRFKYRISLSKLLAVGFVLFIDEIIENLKNNKKENTENCNFYTSIPRYFIESVSDEFKYFKNYGKKLKKPQKS